MSNIATSNPPLAERVHRLEVSQTIAMAQKARELAEQGLPVIKLTLGEPDFQTPDHIKAAAKQAIDEGFTYYTPVPGIQELRQGIAQKLRRDNGLSWEAKNIVVSTGAKQSLANIFLALLNPGDEVVILAPYWVSYSEIVKLAEGVPVIVTSGVAQDFKVSAEQVAAAISPRTKAILYSSPSNPTGAVFSRAELEALAEVVARHPQVYVVADEIYEYITFVEDYFSIGAVPAIQDRVITVNGFSKGFAMTGWRVGYMAGPDWLAQACDKIQGQVTSGTCSIAQKAALAAITSDLGPTMAMKAAYQRRRDLMISLSADIPGFKTNIPQGAFYLFPDLSAYFGKSFGGKVIQDADDLCLYLLSEAHVATVPGSAFGAPDCIRISYAASDEELVEAMSRLRVSLAKLME
ncbi:MAG: pyridoxal phosphate-dependent aminotransferase [Microscillaceae bacterium]|nr:pyridoxal phosphate-dependent aminotransferase [Microscillaceae bacterium]